MIPAVLTIVALLAIWARARRRRRSRGRRPPWLVETEMYSRLTGPSRYELLRKLLAPPPPKS